MVLRYTSVITLVQVDKIEGEEMNTTAGRFKIALNNIKENGFASVFYPYNYVRDIKQHYGIDLKVDECHRIVYDK